MTQEAAAVSGGRCVIGALTSHDKTILDAIFSELPPQLGGLTTGGDFHQTLAHSDDLSNEAERAPGAAEARRMEARGVEAASGGDLSLAVELFTAAIALGPSRPSPYNNRAQALRLMHDVIGAEDDLEQAVTLSEGRGPTAIQAYTQRGLLRRLQGKEAEALDDFKHAAALGGEFAREQVVALNPYAALCGAIVAEMLERERNGPPAPH